MAAALRCAARRLGGSLLQRPKAAVMEERRWLGGSLLQRTQAAFAEERRPLVPSGFMHSRQLSSEAGDVTARRLGGSLLQPWRTPAVVAEERRRLMPSSLMHSRELSSEVFSQRARQTQKEKELRDLLEQRKQELQKRIAKREKIRTTREPPKYIELTLTLLAVILGAMMGLAEVTVMSIFYLFLLILILGDDSKKGEEEQAVTEEENK